MDAADIRRAALRADAAFQAPGGHARAKSHDAARELGHDAERLVPGCLQRHIPR